MSSGNLVPKNSPDPAQRFKSEKPFPAQPPKPGLDEEILWHKCPVCKELTFIKHFARNLKVCPHCNTPNRLRWNERLNYLLDPGSFVELNSDLVGADPLQFQTRTESYARKLQDTRRKTGLNDGLVSGYGRVRGQPLAVAVADFTFMGASMGSVFGEKLVRLAEFAIKNRLPLLTISNSGGARMHEGLFSLMQMAKTTAALAKLGQAQLPHIALLVDPCYGGVTASYTMVADVILAEPGALIGFAGPRVIEQTTRQSLPQGFQTAEFLLDHGMLDQVVERKNLPSHLADLLGLLKVKPLTFKQAFDFTPAFQKSFVAPEVGN